MGKKKANIFIYVILGILTVVVLYPLYFIVLNSFKGKFYISKQPHLIYTAQIIHR